MTQRIEGVLDKLYNLKGDNNFVIADIEKNIKKAEDSITNATEEQNVNEIKKSDVIGKLTVFNNQKDAFLDAFSDLNDETFSSLREIGVMADFGTMVETINNKAPEYCENLDKEIKEYEALIETAKSTVALEAEIVAELEDNKRNEEEKRDKLVSLMEQSLSTEEVEREALSTSYVKKILNSFELFTDEEVVSLAKLIMFPEDGLIEYNDAYDETVAARFFTNGVKEDEEEVVEEIVEEVVEEPTEHEKVEETTEEDIVEEIAPIIEEVVEENKETSSNTEEMYQDITESEEVTDIIDKYNDGNTTEIALSALNQANEEENTILSSIEVEEEKDIDKYIESIGLNMSKVTSELKEMLSESDYKLIEDNYEVLRSCNIKEEAIYNVVEGHNYLVDKDLNKKLTLLRSKGVSENKIKEILEKENTNFRLSIDELTDIVNNILDKESKLTDDNVYKIDVDTKLFDSNKKALDDAGYDLEEKEERNYGAVIYASPYIPSDIRVLKDYLISIVKRNSKYALSVFWKNPSELTKDIDDIIEAGLENILETNPEVLEENNSELIKRVKYCHESGHQVFVGEDKDLYCDYITNYNRFQEKIGNIEDLTEIESYKNNKISDIIGNNKEFVSKLVDALNKYYENPDEYKEFTSEVNGQYENLKKTVLNSIGYESVGKYTYKVKDVCVSKNKLDRHLKVMLSALLEDKKEYDGLEREMIITAILYNMRIEDDKMEKLIKECLNQGGNK